MELFDLTSRVALVTGGARGIGLSIAWALANAGAAVALADRDGDEAGVAAEDLAAQGYPALALAADVTDVAQVRRAVDDTVANLGGLDILVNNAGTQVPGLPEELGEAGWHRVIDTNLTSAWLCSWAAYPALCRAGSAGGTGGRVINIASVLAIFAVGRAAAYGASKGGMVQLTRALANAWAADGVRVNCLLPGWTETSLTAPIREHLREFSASVVARTPAGRWGQPEDMAGAAVFLASAASDFVTGQGIVVDGGYSAQG